MTLGGKTKNVPTEVGVTVFERAGIDITQYKEGSDLDAEELNTVLTRCSEMFAADKTCVERQRMAKERHETFLRVTETMTQTIKEISQGFAGELKDLHTTASEQDARLKVMEDCNKRHRQGFNVKIAVAVLVLAVVEKWDAIKAFLK